MKVELFFYTGSGNSYWVARRLAAELGNAEAHPMLWQRGETILSRAACVGIIFPVHIWGLPRRVIAFVEALARDPSKYYFAIATNAGQVAATLRQLEKLMRLAGFRLSAGFSLVMPSNYIPWGGPGSQDEIISKIDIARERIKKIAAIVSEREKASVEKGPLWQNILLSGVLNRLSFKHIPKMDKSFWSDDKCNGCGICKTICPCGNIELKKERPVWLNNCEQCLACIQWCPEESIQFGKKTIKYKRYHHPEIKLNDVIALANLKKIKK